MKEEMVWKKRDTERVGTFLLEEHVVMIVWDKFIENGARLSCSATCVLCALSGNVGHKHGLLPFRVQFTLINQKTQLIGGLLLLQLV